MIRHTLIVLSLMIGGPAAALSCLPHDVATTFKRVQASPDIYVGILGTLTFDESRLPVVDMQNQQDTPPVTRIPAQISGHTLSAEGFVTPFERNILLNVQCAGPWCAQPHSGIEYMGFMRSDGGRYSLSIGPCGGDAFGKPTRAMRETVRECFAGGECRPSAGYPQ